MRKTISKKIEQTINKEEVYCDICGNKASMASFADASWNVDPRDYRFTETTKIILKEGEQYIEGGYYEEIAIDICPKCFKEKLIPWLKSQGVKIQKREVDY